MQGVLPTISPQQVRIFQIIQSGLATGATLFGVVVLIVYQQQGSNQSASSEGQDVVSILSFDTGIISLACYGAALIVPRLRILFVAGRARQHQESVLPAPLQILLRQTIFRLALLEAPAFYGLTVSLVAIHTGGMDRFPEYALNAIPLFILLLVCFSTFPTTDCLDVQMEELNHTQQQQ